MGRLLLAAALALALVAGGVRDGQAGPRGRWRFSDDARPVKVVVVGGSVSAWPSGSYSDWVGGLCRNVELINRAKAKLGTRALRERLEDEVIRNKLLDLPERVASGEEVWLIFMAGLNSIGSPEATNLEVTKTFALAHQHGMKVMGLTPNPWGAESDRRWRGYEGLAYLAHTQKVVDHFFGRLGPEDALGRFSEGRTEFAPGERADITVDLWDATTLRDRDAPRRDPARLAREVRRSAFLRAALKGLDGDQREFVLAAHTVQALELPQWYMKPAFIGFDAVHPNGDGHREIGRAICKAAPASWGCACDQIDGLRWDKRARALVPVPPAPPEAP